MAAPTVATVSPGATSSASNTLTINKPSGTVSGDFLLAFCGSEGPRNWQEAAGWTLYAYNGGVDSAGGWYWKWAGGSEPSSYSFTIDGSADDLAGAILRIEGVDTVSPVAAHPTGVTGDSSTPNPPASGTVALGDYLAVAMVTLSLDVTFTPPTNYDEKADLVGSSGSPAMATSIATRGLVGITSEDPGTFTASGSDPWTTMTALILGMSVTLHAVSPTDDITTTGWTTTPLWSKIDEDPASPDATIITATAS
jgi:hypothetical protein